MSFNEKSNFQALGKVTESSGKVKEKLENVKFSCGENIFGECDNKHIKQIFLWTVM